MNSKPEQRLERDSMGEVPVPATALYGAQTQRAVNNFRLGGGPMPAPFIHALGLVKRSAALANGELGELDQARAEAIAAAAHEVELGRHDQHFPVDVFQTGSGTSTNMNANEVIARLAGAASGLEIHPNDHVNRGQSSNDVIPTTLHVATLRTLRRDLLPALDLLTRSIERRAEECADVVKTGRTHLMDAMPMTLGQEMRAWAAQVRQTRTRLQEVAARLAHLAQGATAIGTGVNAHGRFGERFAQVLSRLSGIEFQPADNLFAALAAQDTAVELSGHLRTTAVALTKIANDLRWMNSGPLTGLAEIRLPALQPGSSIMPGKVNPVIPEAVCMACARVMGHDSSVTLAGQAGNFQLNVMLPLIADCLLDSLNLLAHSAGALAEQAIDGMEVNRPRLEAQLQRNPVLATALNPVIGYERAADIAKRAFAEGRTVLEVAEEMTDLGREELRRLLDPARLTGE